MSRAAGALGAIEGGYDTARLSGAEADKRRRAEREADAARYLTRKGHADILPILGLTPDVPARKAKPRQRRTGDPA